MGEFDSDYQLADTSNFNSRSEVCPSTPSEFTRLNVPHMSQVRIWKNIIVVSVAFMINFTAYQGTANLQSSINGEGGLGQQALASVFAAIVISSVLLPVTLINIFGCKWVIFLAVLTYFPFMISQFYPAPYTLLPSGFLVGVGAGPLWCAKCTYFTILAEQLSKATGVRSEAIVQRFFGVFFLLFQTSQITGNLISSLVLATDNGETDTLVNNSYSALHCGSNFCPNDRINDTIQTSPPTQKVHSLMIIYIGCVATSAIIIAFLVDSVKKYEATRVGSGTGVSTLKRFIVTAKLVKERNLLCLIPAMFFSGLFQAFISADYTMSFVTCAWGVSHVGYVLACYGVMNALGAFVSGWLAKYVGRFTILCFSFGMIIVVLLTALFWTPALQRMWMFFALAALWGVAEGTWLVHINTLCGILFPGREEAGYSNFRIWESLGFIAAYLYSPRLCVDTKIYMLLGVVCIGFTLYSFVEYTEVKRRRKVQFSVP